MIRTLAAFIFACVAVVYLQSIAPAKTADTKLLQHAQLAGDSIDPNLRLNRRQRGEVVMLADNRRMKDSYVNYQLDRYYANEKSYIYYWRDSLKNFATATAQGVDYKHYFVNSYLVGIHPFNVENKWLPLYVLSKRKAYQLDDEQYGVADMWQNSAQAYQLPRGDCEDHAIALADWLISEGIDARVVVGKYKDGGHAWVVANQNEQMYILEATDKRAGKSWNHYPLASLSQHYYPQYMFNREYFWENTSTPMTKDYLGEHWKKRSKYNNSTSSNSD
ncbi:transglutaminase domain-containing protein [Thalassotalea sp. HSM 43]|uniref:transglutaminase domain-containing protein n=1 Tax=Thalassotalea sp. HSM 43 TaxID=2552945 RepID=UPI001080C5D7|nr:transglutaminase domain-containing protein [Thalassotalea sp. HSM 43]QBY06040.1 transglutaminase domain-containing protein [Thalassotalea sp. HSM 43]